jgi:N-acetylneuraminic acid mutarotase
VNASNEILAWRPGHRVQVVGRLPHPLRYAAVAALGRNLYIAGGSTPTGASHDVLAFDTTTHKLTLAARLPRPTTHAAATGFGCCVYVIGGRQEQVGTPTRRIFAIQPGRRRIRTAGRLPVPLSDLGAVAQRRRILAIGGRTTAGTVDTIVELRPQR